jgi:methanogenic corrinoid protein MtbC1
MLRGAPEVEAFLGAILAGDHRRALAVARAGQRLGIANLYEHVVQPALDRVGHLWSQNAISVAEEHLASAVAESAIAALYPEFPWPTSPSPHSALVTCVQGNLHRLGPRMIADLLLVDGWDALFLGADTPVEALAELARKRKPVFVALSIAISSTLPAARGSIAALGGIVPKVHVLVGGRVVAMRPDLAHELGADAVATSASEGTRIARRWKP